MSIQRTIPLGERSPTRIGIGTNRLTDTPENRAFLREAVAAGIDFIDTAHLYTGGASERTIGAALAPFDDRLLVATKGGYEPGSGHPDRLREELEASFERLRTETIALYYLHRVDPEVPLEESLGLIKEYRDAGRIEQIGVSEVTVEQLERARTVVSIAAVQNEYNLGERKHDPVVEHCASEGIPFVPFYPLRGADAPAVEKIARRHGVSTRQVALAWLLGRSPTMAPIPGSLSVEHVSENLAAFEIELSDEDRATLSSGKPSLD